MRPSQWVRQFRRPFPAHVAGCDCLWVYNHCKLCSLDNLLTAEARHLPSPLLSSLGKCICHRLFPSTNTTSTAYDTFTNIHTNTRTHQYRFNRLAGTASTHGVHQLFLTNRYSVENLFYRLISSSVILSQVQGFPNSLGRVPNKIYSNRYIQFWWRCLN